MAPFSKRQIGYIKAVAGVGQTKSFIHYNNAKIKFGSAWWSTDGGDTLPKVPDRQTSVVNGSASSGDSSNCLDTDTKKLCAYVGCLDNIPLTVDWNHETTGDINGVTFQQSSFNGPFGVPNPMFLLTSRRVIAEGDDALSEVDKTAQTLGGRVGDDFYLESTHIKWRFTMPDFASVIGTQTPHHEYRWIVFRQRKPTLGYNSYDANKGEAQWLNWNYDLFNGYQGRPIGPKGYREREQFDGKESYESTTGGLRMWIGTNDTVGDNTGAFMHIDADDLMTLPINDADYVVMRDERFFLGAEHGKSHYETVTRFDWSDPGSTINHDLIDGLDHGKNYRWWFLLLGTTNNTIQPVLNVSVRGTTSLTSA
jgi:hypothetical protein